MLSAHSATSSRHWPGFLVAAVFFAANAPTLPWLDFSNGSENLNVATALEIRRTGNWLVPTLQGEERINKPPLTAWITASLISRSTFDSLSSRDPAVRAAAYRAIAWQIRWPALLCSCLAVVAVYQLARIIGGGRLAIVSTLVFATTFAFTRFGRSATTDVQLTLWVLVANVFLASALIQGNRWTGFVGAGMAIALAFMSKGPVALAQTVAPATALVAFHRRVRGTVTGERPSPGPWLIGLVLALLMASPWFLHVMVHYDVWGRWHRDLITGPGTLPDSRWYAYHEYISFLPMLIPWTAYFVAGLIVAIVLTWTAIRAAAKLEARNPRPDLCPIAYVLFLTAVPILIMTWFPERKERYLLPMIGPAAILIAYAILTRDIPDRFCTLLGGIQWCLAAGLGVLFPLVGVTRLLPVMTRADGSTWFTWALAIPVAGFSLLVLLVGLRLYRRHPMSLVVTTVLLMLVMQTMSTHAYRHSDVAQSRPLANAIWARFPEALMYSYRPGQPGRRAPEELSIYLNRAVRPINDLAAVREADVTQVVMVYQRAGQPMPVVPGTWVDFGTLARDRDVWHAFAVPPTPSGNQAKP